VPEQQAKRGKKYSYLELFRNAKLSKITVVLMVSWFLRYFTYYGIQFSLAMFGTGLNSSLFFVSLAEVLAAFTSSKRCERI
jgi:hypothetical protein